jgi:hypothetical protein
MAQTNVQVFSGNVGIGTTDPANKLHVETPTGVSTNLVKIASSLNSGSSQSVSGIDFAANPAFFNSDNSQRVAAEITSGFYDGGAADWGDAYISLRTPNDPSDGTINDALTIRGGNVGIGTTNPIGLLSIVRDTVVGGSNTYQRGVFYKDGKLQITPPDLYNGYPLDGDFLTTSRYETDGNTDYTAAALGVAYDTVSGSKSALYFKTAEDATSLTEKMRITGDGNVGIGTDSPAGKLTIGSTASLFFADNRGASTARNWAIRVNNTNEGDFQIGHTGSNTGGLPNFYTTQGDAKVTISRDGNVGIGTANPYAPLAVVSTRNADTWAPDKSQLDVLHHNGVGTTYGMSFAVSLTHGDGIIQTFNRTSGVAAYDLRLQPNVGRVGIGTTDPRAKLHVNGGIILEAEDIQGVTFDNASDAAQRINTYIAFGDAGTENDWCYLRQIGPSNSVELCYDFHDDGNDARFTIRDVKSTSSPDVITTRFRVNADAVSIPGSLTVAGSGVSSDDRIKYNESDIPNALNLINKLKPQKYEKLVAVSVEDKRGIWMPLDEEWESVKDDHEYVHEFGFIAQAVRDIPDLAFLVTGEETKMMTTTKTPIEYSNLTTDEQGTYTPSYVYGRKSITQEEYSNLISNVQELYTLEYVKETETQNPLALNYNGLFVVAIGAIKELKAKNDTLEAQVANLLERVTALESI